MKPHRASTHHFGDIASPHDARGLSRGIDPQSYLRDVLTRLPTLTNRQIKDVTPDAWAKARQLTAQRQAA